MNFNVRQIKMQMQMTMSGNWIKFAGNGDNYKVTFKDGSKKDILSFMYTDTVLHKKFVVLLDEKFPKSDTAHRYRKIYPGETSSLTFLFGFNGDVDATGEPADSCWRFRVTMGKITMYGKYPAGYEDEFPASAVISIQLKNGPELKYSEATLGELLASDPNAIQLFNKKKYYKAILKFNSDALKQAQ